MSGGWFRRFRRSAAHAAVMIFSGLVRLVPFQAALVVGRSVGIASYFLFLRHRRAAFDSLATAFGSDLKQIRVVAGRCFLMMGEALFETIYYALRKDAVLGRVRIVGEEHLKAALSKGKGVVCLTAHFGNFPIMMYALRESGYSVNTMLRPLRAEQTSVFLERLMLGRSIMPIFSYPRKEAVFKSLKALRNNELLFVLMDQNFGTGGVWVRFFGKLAATPVGPIILASRSQSPIVPMRIVREKPGEHTVYIEPELPMEIRNDPDESTLVNAIVITRKIEGWIRANPEQWGWIHRRWKSQPTPDEAARKYAVEGVGI
jgi:KDO2-lipid IV(A) lauroyltransferase